MIGAKEFFKLEWDWRRAEDRMDEFVIKQLQLVDSKTLNYKFEDISYDQYDSSVDITGIDPEHKITPEMLKPIFDLGFRLIWLNDNAYTPKCTTILLTRND